MRKRHPGTSVFTGCQSYTCPRGGGGFPQLTGGVGDRTNSTWRGWWRDPETYLGITYLPGTEATTHANLRKKVTGDFPGGPGAKTPCSQCRGPGFDPWLGN